MLDDIKELFQSFIAPALEGMRGDLRAMNARIDTVDARIEAIDTKFDARFDALDVKVESYRRELAAGIHRVEQVCQPTSSVWSRRLICGWLRWTKSSS